MGRLRLRTFVWHTRRIWASSWICHRGVRGAGTGNANSFGWSLFFTREPTGLPTCVVTTHEPLEEKVPETKPKARMQLHIKSELQEHTRYTSLAALTQTKKEAIRVLPERYEQMGTKPGRRTNRFCPLVGFGFGTCGIRRTSHKNIINLLCRLLQKSKRFPTLDSKRTLQTTQLSYDVLRERASLDPRRTVRDY